MTNSVTFSDLAVAPCMANVLREQGITEPFEVQMEAIPDGMLGRDVCCRSPTGSGKTLAFGLPLLSRCARAQPNYPTALIVTPTRELAEQICTVLKPLASVMDLEVMSVYGGTSYAKQRRALDKGVDVVVACPGRLLDLMNNGMLSLEDVGIVVLDEADRMADMGFMEPVCRILDNCSPKRQTILFSATLDDEVADLVRDYQTDPVTIKVGPKQVSMESMQHFFWLMRSSMKAEIAGEAIRKRGKSIVFCRTRAGVDRVGDELADEGVSVATLHGGLNQRQRDRAMKRFSNGDCLALIATDVAARGIDIQGVQSVIHYDPPESGKVYKHRSGRTARAGEHGVVISLVQKPQKGKYGSMQKQVGIRYDFTPPDFTKLPETDFEYIPCTNPNRSSRGRSSYNGRSSRGRSFNGRSSSRGRQQNGRQQNGRPQNGRQQNGRQQNGRNNRGDNRNGRNDNRNGRNDNRNGRSDNRNGRSNNRNDRSNNHDNRNGRNTNKNNPNNRRGHHHRNSRYTATPSNRRQNTRSHR